jgi:hypothetical protein
MLSEQLRRMQSRGEPGSFLKLVLPVRDDVGQVR